MELARYLAERNVVCPGCGYSLRGLKAGACPECGFGFDVESLRALPRGRDSVRGWLSDRAAFILLAGNLGIMWGSLWIDGRDRGLAYQVLHWPRESWRLGAVSASALLVLVSVVAIDHWCDSDPSDRARRWRTALLVTGLALTAVHAFAFLATLAWE